MVCYPYRVGVGDVTETDVALRLRKIEGQVRGIQRMVEDGRACPDLLTQLMAVRAAVDGFSITLLTEHMDSCITGGQLSTETRAALAEALRLFLRLGGTQVAPHGES